MRMEAVKLCLLSVLFAVVRGQLQVGFDQLDYAINEGDQRRTVTVLKEGENVGSLLLRITSLTFEQFFSEGNSLPDALQNQDLHDPAEFDSERQDFSNMIQMVTFPPSSTEELQILNITVFDDAINEATEGYLLMVEVITDMSDPQDTANLELVNGGISLVVVTDNDEIALGFEQTQYTVREDVGSLSGVSVIKENGVITEQNLTVLLQSVNGDALEGLDYDGTAGGSMVLTLLPTEQSVPVEGIGIINDNIPESVEQFLLQLSRPTGAPFTLGATPAFITIIDEDVAVVGFEQVNYTVGEGDGVVEVCVVLDSGEFPPAFIVLNVPAIGSSAEALADFVPPIFAFISLPRPNEPALRDCINITIQDDTLTEPTEQFELQLVPFPGVMLPPNIIRRPNTTTIHIIDNDVLCLDPPTIMNGMRTFTGNSVGDTATYSCNSGFELIGNETTTCTAATDGISATFPSVPPPECRPLCLDPPTVMNGMRTFTGNSVGDTATYSCNSGFELNGVATTTCTATSDGNSASFPSVPPPECRPLCLDPPTIMNGMRTFTGNSVGDTATYSCDPGFELIGNATTTCTAAADGNAAAFPSVPPPECRPLCLDPPTIMNGMRTFTGNSVGDTATYSCDPGFELIGVETTTCTAASDRNSASFPSVPLPQCRPLCLDPPTIVNGMRTFTGNSVGDTATYSCNPGFELIGIATTTCTAASDGNSASFPSVPPPECRPMLPNDTLTNDTLIGDPLYAVPFSKDGVSLCFEVHGAASQYFNLVSDTCTNVNVFYAPSPLLNDSRNFVEEIGVRAVGRSGTCYNIRVYESDSEGLCIATVDDTTVGPSGIEVDGIRVRRIMDRVRISVPNCENINLVMWVTCEERNGLRMLRFDISRGLTLRPTSHGLIGQFWNIPIAYDPNPFGGMLRNGYDNVDVRIVTVSPVDNSPLRQFLAERQSQTWVKSPNTCFYAGNGQGGRSGAGQPDDSVIQGHYSEYRVGGLFQHVFRYAKFENNRCL